VGGRGRSTDFRRGESLGTRDHLISYEKPKVKPDWLSQANYDAAPETLRVRELHCKAGKGNKGKTLVTTMCLPKAIQERRAEGAVQAALADRDQFSTHQDNAGDGCAELQNTRDG